MEATPKEKNLQKKSKGALTIPGSKNLEKKIEGPRADQQWKRRAPAIPESKNLQKEIEGYHNQ